MTHPGKSISKAGKKSSTRKSKLGTQAKLPDETLKQSQLDEISAGKLLAEPAKQEHQRSSTSRWDGRSLADDLDQKR